MSRSRVALVFALLAVLAAAAGTGCSAPPSHASTALYALAVRPDDVKSFAVTESGRTAEYVHRDDAWQPVGDSPVASAPLLLTSEDTLLPIGAYRKVLVNPAEAQFGLARPSLSVTVTTVDGGRVRVDFGAESFNRAGFYAHHPGDRTVYLVPRSTMSALLSVARGEPVSLPGPADEKVRKALEEGTSPSPSVDPSEESPWLKQALSAQGGSR